jgi:hypothetical protein
MDDHKKTFLEEIKARIQKLILSFIGKEGVIFIMGTVFRCLNIIDAWVWYAVATGFIVSKNWQNYKAQPPAAAPAAPVASPRAPGAGGVNG